MLSGLTHLMDLFELLDIWYKVLEDSLSSHILQLVRVLYTIYLKAQRDPAIKMNEGLALTCYKSASSKKSLLEEGLLVTNLHQTQGCLIQNRVS